MDTFIYPNDSSAANGDHAPKKAAAVAHDAIDHTAQAVHHAIDKVGPAADRWIDAIRRNTIENPLTALGIAIAVGFVLGRII